MSTRPRTHALLVVAALTAVGCAPAAMTAGDGGDVPATSTDARANDATAPPDATSTGDASVLDASAVTDASTADAATSDAPTPTDAPASNCPVPDTRDRDLWVWDTAPGTDAAARTRLLEFARDHGIRGLYLESEALLVERPASLATFVRAAREQCIAVELLFGNAEWALRENHARPLALARAAAEYARTYPDAPIAGVHYDVEPYGLPEWMASGGVARVASQYLEMLEGIAAITRPAGVRLAVDTPFWFNLHPVAYGGAPSTPLDQLVAARVDRVTIMDYRDRAVGTDGIIENARSALAAARDAGHELVIGVETMDLKDQISFWQEGAAVLERELGLTRDEFATHPSFRGFAVHHYGSYRDLAP